MSNGLHSPIVKKISLLFLFLVAINSILALQARADTVTLLTGEKLEGRITGETDTDVTLDIKVSASISDERVIPKKEIQKIDKLSPEEAAFQAIKDYKIDPQSSFKAEDYTRLIGPLKSFLDTYPAGAHAAEVKLTLAAFQTEKARVDAGELKFKGAWLSSAEASKRRLQINGQQVYDMMKFQAGRQDWSGALNSFDTIEKRYAAARVYPDAVDLAVQILISLQKQVAERIKMIAYTQTEFAKVLSMAKPEEAPRLRDAEKREQDQYSAAMAAAKKAGMKWGPFIPRNSESMGAMEKAIPGEISRLKALPTQKMHASVSLADEAQAALASRQTDSAASLVEDSLKAWPVNDEALRLKSEIAPVKAATAKPSATVSSGQEDSGKKSTTGKSSVSQDASDAKPFYMTAKGALMIAGGILVLFGIIALIGRLQQSKGKSE